MPEGSKTQQDDALRTAIIVEFPLRVIRVRLDLNNRRLDSSGVDNPAGAFNVDVGQTYRGQVLSRLLQDEVVGDYSGNFHRLTAEHRR